MTVGVRECPICGNGVLGEGRYCPVCTGRAEALAERTGTGLEEAFATMRAAVRSALSDGFDWDAALAPVVEGGMRSSRGRVGGTVVSGQIDPLGMSDEELDAERRRLASEIGGGELPDELTEDDREFYGRQMDRTGHVELGDPEPVLGRAAIEGRVPLHNRSAPPNRKCAGECQVWIRVDGPPGLRVLCPSCGGPMEEV